MLSSRYRLEMHIPPNPPLRRKGAGGVLFFPFQSVTPAKDWQYNEGQVLWTVGGVPLLDGSFALYPWDVLENVVTIVEFAAAHREGHEHVCGSILTLFTRPEGSRRATFGISSAVQRGATGAGAQPERREVIAPVADVVKSVVAAARELALHVPLIPPPRPTIDERGTRDPMALAMLNRLDRLDALSPPRRSVY